MSDLPDHSLEIASSATATPPAGRFRWQVGLQTVALLIGTVAVWMAVVVNRRHIDLLEARIKVMRSLAHDLVIDDPSQIAVVRREQHWFDENWWDVSLPDGNYRLCMATREVDGNGLPPKWKSTPLAAGRHRLGLSQTSDPKVHRLVVANDGTDVLAVEEPIDWDPNTGYSGGGEFDTSTQLQRTKPVVLFRRRFMGPRDANNRSTVPTGPTNGIILWIESAGEPPSKP